MSILKLFLLDIRSKGLPFDLFNWRLYHKSIFDVKEEVANAVARREPVVALESAIITHGMQYPHNFETALEVEEIIRNQGATPATTAVINGKIKVGFSPEDFQRLAENNKCVKVSRRDIPFVTSQKLTGGTTVSGTMLIAHRVGIHVFVTGGIGGVHRGGENTMDVSADLIELGRTPVAVVSSGIKSILDIGRTLEYLETQGVAVATFGSSKNFPAFYTARSQYSVPHCLDSPEKAAECIKSMLDLRLDSGILIAVPIPEEFSFDEVTLENAIKEGIEESERNSIHGKDVTPFLLQYVSRVTKGRALESNRALIKNNALIGARISVELSKLQLDRESCGVDVKNDNVKVCSDKVSDGIVKSEYDSTAGGNTYFKVSTDEVAEERREKKGKEEKRK